MKDLAKKEYLDEARFELGTEVQFFKFGLEEVISILIALGLITIGLFYLTPISIDIILGGFFGAFLLLLYFYIKIGTN